MSIQFIKNLKKIKKRAKVRNPKMQFIQKKFKNQVFQES